MGEHIGKHEKLPFFVPRAIFHASNHDGITQECPKCHKVFTHYGNLESIGFEQIKGKVYRHKECGQLLDFS